MTRSWVLASACPHYTEIPSTYRRLPPYPIPCHLGFSSTIRVCSFPAGLPVSFVNCPKSSYGFSCDRLSKAFLTKVHSSWTNFHVSGIPKTWKCTRTGKIPGNAILIADLT